MAPGYAPNSDRIAEALFGQTKRRVLGLLFGRPGQSFYLRQIVRETGAGIGAVQRELAHLAEADLIQRSPHGNQVHFTANTHSPVYEELRKLLAKTAGLADVLRASLSHFLKKDLIELALLYGSVASGKQRAESDVDLLIVGRVRLSELLPRLRQAQSQLGREINPTVYRREEFLDKFRRREHFVRRVLERPKLMLIGSDNDIARLVGESVAVRA